MGMMAGTSIMGIAMDPIWYAAIHPNIFITPVVMLVVIVFLAVLYPAGKAALIQPAEAMRYN
jgi:ABC-type lipoprotein release transport system permease subunit